jgi:hypothetical protein
MTTLRRALIVLIVITLLSPIGGGVQASPPPPTAGGSSLVQVTPDPVGLTVTWTLPRPTLTPTDRGLEVALAGLEATSAAADLRLPSASLLVALPPDAHPTVTLVTAQREALAWTLPRSPAPADPVRLEELGVMRGVRLARLTLQPVGGGAAGWETLRQAEVRLDFGAAVVATPDDGDPLRAALRQEVANPAQVMVAAPAPAAAPPDMRGHWLIEVEEAGLTTVTTAALAAAGFPITTTTLANLQLTRAGATIPVAVSGDRLRFYAAPRSNRYTGSDFYDLAVGDAPASTWATRSGDPTGLPPGGGASSFLFEENKIYYPNNHPGPEIPPGRDGDRWMWASLLHTAGGPTAVFTNTFTLPPLASTAGDKLTLWLIGYTDVAATPDHHLAVALNGQPLDDVTWDGKTAITATLAIPAGVLRAGANQLDLTLPGGAAAVDGVWLDAFEITTTPVAASDGRAVILADPASATYPRQLPAGQAITVLDVTAPDAPVQVTDFSLTPAGALVIGSSQATSARYAVATAAGERTPRRIRPAVPLSALPLDQKIDQFILAYPDFIPALAPLRELRAREGISTHVESVQAIYDAYDGGRPTPDALRAYLIYAYTARSYIPSYALLVGDGTFDPRGYLPNTLPTYLPPFLANVDPWAGETASDTQFALVDGADHLPDLMVGRLPVNSLAETQTVVSKLVGYAAAAPAQPWTGEWLFVADNPDNDGDYPSHLQTLMDELAPGAFRPHPYFYPQTNFSQNLQAEWSQGAGFVIYNGHSSVDQWAVERVLHTDDVPRLTNGMRLPFLLEMTCFTASFHIPDRATLDEALLRSPLGGALGVWGSTGLGITEGQFYLAEGFIRQVRHNVQPTLGGGMMAGYVHLLSRLDSNEDLIDTYLLLGDPATRLQIASFTFLPLARK